jgi:hypothetical protein
VEVSGVSGLIDSILANPLFWDVTGSTLAALLGYAAHLLHIDVKPGVIAGASKEVIDYFNGEASEQRDENGKLTNIVYVEQLRKVAVDRVRLVLLDRKPKFLPMFLWKFAVKRLTSEIISYNIEGVLEKIKQLKNK